MNPLSAVGDWETASRNAIKTVYPNIALFHHNRAVWRKITKLGLVTLFHTNASFKKFLKSIRFLPLLPLEHIIPMFEFVTSIFEFSTQKICKSRSLNDIISDNG